MLPSPSTSPRNFAKNFSISSLDLQIESVLDLSSKITLLLERLPLLDTVNETKPRRESKSLLVRIRRDKKRRRRPSQSVSFVFISKKMWRREFWSFVLLCGHVSMSISMEIVVFSHGEEGYHCVRIPSLFRTRRGTLLAFGEGRIGNCNDNTQINIVYKRSLDEGKTWPPLMILHRGNSSTDDETSYVGNFAPVQLNYRERILVPFCRNNRFLLQSYSDDDGLTFFPPESILNVTKPEWTWVALGPPVGLLLQSNRILIPGDYSTDSVANGGSFSSGFVMLNDFNGSSDRWYRGGEYSLQQFYPNEGQAVELLPSSNTIFISDDQGEHWTFVQSICPGSSGYSSMTFLNNRSIGILYEKGAFFNAPATLAFTLLQFD